MKKKIFFEWNNNEMLAMIFMGAVEAESGTQQLQNDDEEWVDYSVHGLINHVMEKNQESKVWI